MQNFFNSTRRAGKGLVHGLDGSARSAKKSNSQTGLSRSAAAALIEEYGYNELDEKPPEPSWKRLARQFNDLTIWILFAAACIAVAFGEWMDGMAILAIVILNGLLGFVQENRAGRALLALRKMTAPQSRVIR